MRAICARFEARGFSPRAARTYGRCWATAGSRPLRYARSATQICSIGVQRFAVPLRARSSGPNIVGTPCSSAARRSKARRSAPSHPRSGGCTTTRGNAADDGRVGGRGGCAALHRRLTQRRYSWFGCSSPRARPVSGPPIRLCHLQVSRLCDASRRPGSRLRGRLASLSRTGRGSEQAQKDQHDE